MGANQPGVNFPRSALFARDETCCFCFRYTIFKDHITLGDYEIHDGMNLELYYQ